MKLREAVTAIFVYQEKIFVIKRQNYLSVFPGYHAFPGGKVDKSDHNFESSNELTSDFENHLVGALFREVKEELDFDLENAVNSKLVSRMSLFGTATTPEFNPYRFKTYFFLVELNELPTFTVDEGEVERSEWISPQAMIEEYEQAKVLAVPPTVKAFEALAKDLFPKKQVDLDLHYIDAFDIPMIESVKGVKQFLPLSNTFPPANRTNCFLIGDDHRVLIDPSPKNQKELDKFLHTLKAYQVDEIFLTHHHPDHHEFSVDMAMKLNIPMGMGKLTFEYLTEDFGDNYFLDRDIKLYEDGDTITKSIGEDVQIYHVPGHDQGQLALAPKTLNWFIAGDLIQTIGTVVVGGTRASMSDYFTSLEKVISLSPRFVFPSHGIGMGGTNKLEMTLKHREHREEQIKELLDQGKSEDEIYDEIYEGLEERLKKYALASIRAHITKILLDQNPQG